MDKLGSYRLRKRLAVGGMGEVYLGEKLGPEGFVKPVVLKCVLPQLAADRAFLNLFLDEARLAALLNHPNIAQIYDFGIVDDIHYIAMEYVPGYTLDEIRRKLSSIGQFIPLQHLACIASQACQGLHYAHSLTDGHGVGLGLVHRDVSPHNLIVSTDGTVKLVDFGIAKARDGLARVQAKGAVGKYGYMSPEQVTGVGVDHRSDLFSLGVCMWELCTNARLHDPALEAPPSYSPAAPIRSIEEYRADMPTLFAHIVDSALSIESSHRFASAKDMHLALEQFQVSMSHFAGPTALAHYLDDLVQGRFEDDSATPSIRLGTTPPKPNTPPRPMHPGTYSDPMDRTRAYEEIFGFSSNPPSTVEPPPSSFGTPVSVRPQGADLRPSSSRAPPMPSAPESDHGIPRELEFNEPAEPVELAVTVPKVPSEPPRSRDLPTSSARSSGSNPSVTGPLEVRRSRDLPSRNLPSSRDLPNSRDLPKSQTKSSGSIKVMTASLPDPPRNHRFRNIGLVVLLGLIGLAAWQSDQWVPLLSSPPPPVERSKYRIVTEPSGAQVRVNGELQSQKTPFEIDLEVNATFTIEAFLAGRATKQAELKTAPGPLVRPLKFLLEPAGTVIVRSKPRGAAVKVEGRSVGKTPVAVRDAPTGRAVRVQVELSGYQSASKRVRLEPGSDRTVEFQLQR